MPKPWKLYSAEFRQQLVQVGKSPEALAKESEPRQVKLECELIDRRCFQPTRRPG